MADHISVRRTFIHWSVFGVVFFFAGSAYGESADHILSKTLKTRHTLIRYREIQDLRKYDQKIEYYPKGIGIQWLYLGKDKKIIQKRVVKKTDAVFERVREILDMRKKTKPVVIRLYGDKARLDGAYYRIFKKKNNLRAWYVYELNTIYLNLSDLHKGMLAHEMAHFIIDNYLKVRPPSASAEILARYVDSHLE